MAMRATNPTPNLMMMIDRAKWDYGFNLTIKPHQCDLSNRISEGPL